MPGLPKPRPEKPQRPVAPPPPERMRLGWSRGIVDEVRGVNPLPRIPNVRSTAALRARAGEPVVHQEEPKPEPIVVARPYVPAPVPRVREVVVKRPSLLETARGVVRELWESIPRGWQISD